MTKNPLDVRPFLPGDEDFIRNIVGSIQFMAGMEDAVDARDLARLPVSYRAQGGEIWVVEIRGSVVGTVGVRPVEGAAWELRLLYLLPDWRCMGIGRLLCETAVAYAHEHGAASLRADVPGDSDAAVRLLKDLRFRDSDDDGLSGGCRLVRTFA